MLGVSLLAAFAAGAVDLGGEWSVRGEGIDGVARLPGTLADAGLGVRQDYETWAALTNRGEKGALRLSHVYRGKATWSRTVVVPEELSGKPMEVFLERVLWTPGPSAPEAGGSTSCLSLSRASPQRHIIDRSYKGHLLCLGPYTPLTSPFLCWMWGTEVCRGGLGGIQS